MGEDVRSEENVQVFSNSGIAVGPCVHPSSSLFLQQSRRRGLPRIKSWTRAAVGSVGGGLGEVIFLDLLPQQHHGLYPTNSWPQPLQHPRGVPDFQAFSSSNDM